MPKKRTRREVPVKDQEIVISCQVECERMTYQQAQIFEKAITKAAKQAFPDSRVRGLWVNKAIASS